MLVATKKKPGPSQVPGERYPSGQRVPESRKKDQAIAPATFFRLKEHGMRLGADPRLTTVIGRMGLFKELSDAEVDAAFRVAETYGRYEHLKGMPRRHAASPSYQQGYGNRAIDEKFMSEDQVKRHRRLVRRAEKAYDQLQTMLAGDLERALVERVCCDNNEPGPVYKPKLAAILRRLAVEMGIVAPPSTKKPKAEVTAADSNLLAVAAVDALEAWFATERGSSPIGFSLVDNPDWKGTRGVTATDGRMSHTIPVPLRGLTFAAIDAQLRLACAVKGWPELRNADTGEV